MTRPLPDAAVSSHAAAGRSFTPCYTPIETTSFDPKPVLASTQTHQPLVNPTANVDPATSNLDQQLSVLQVEGMEIVREGEALLSGKKRQEREHDHDLESELGSQSEHSDDYSL
jgi:hypothetical protein